MNINFWIRFSVIFSLALLTIFNNSFAKFFENKKRNHISIVGSSTLYPFTTTIAETFGRETDFKTPIVEANGTGGGIKIFCSGVGYQYPDFVNASRRMEKSEIKHCLQNNIKNVLEIKVGYDGIVLAGGVNQKITNLTIKEIFLALASKIPNKNGSGLIDNHYKKWSEINSNLPDVEILIYGPPTSSGTRDAFVELVMKKACEEFNISTKNKKICQVIRSDGRFVEVGENDNLILQKIKNNQHAIGIFGFSFLEENTDKISSIKINNTSPSFQTIASKDYPISRPLFIYAKKEHFNLILGMKEFIQEIVSKDTIGRDGYLLQKGLIPLTDFEIKEVRDKLTESLK